MSISCASPALSPPPAPSETAGASTSENMDMSCSSSRRSNSLPPQPMTSSMGTASRNAAESLAERRCAPRLAAANPRNSPAADQWSCATALGALGGRCAIS
uniref:Uncharacterized protein n=1 Tax=Arundo donax TaxID=35708 RepID=A0A0A9GDX0_ARUDO